MAEAARRKHRETNDKEGMQHSRQLLSLRPPAPCIVASKVVGVLILSLMAAAALSFGPRSLLDTPRSDFSLDLRAPLPPPLSVAPPAVATARLGLDGGKIDDAERKIPPGPASPNISLAGRSNNRGSGAFVGEDVALGPAGNPASVVSPQSGNSSSIGEEGEGYRVVYNITEGRRPDGSFCKAYLKFGGRSEISKRRFHCTSDDDTQVYDLKNVAVQDGTLHIYDPVPETRSLLEAWNHRLPALTYTWGGVHEHGFKVVAHDKPLTESMCPTRSKGVSFYLVPHFQENAFHMHNDNILPMISSILSTPCLCHGVELASCTRYQKNLFKTPPLKQVHGRIHPGLPVIFETLFDSFLKLDVYQVLGTMLAPTIANKNIHCLDHMVWGYVKPYYQDCQEDRSSTTWAWQHYALKLLGIPSPPPPAIIEETPPAPPAGAQPRVLFLKRNAITTGQERTRRFMEDLTPLSRAWAHEDVHMDEWIFKEGASLVQTVESLAGYDIYLGVHGAQLTNTIYGAQGLVLVEFADNTKDNKLFHKVAQARRGGYIKVRMDSSSHFATSDAVATSAVKCALALWRQDADRESVCDKAAPNPGPARSFKPRLASFIEGVSYYYEVGQTHE